MMTALHQASGLTPGVLFQKMQAVTPIICFSFYANFKSSNEGLKLQRITIKHMNI
jgi:hypothetical protein